MSKDDNCQIRKEEFVLISDTNPSIDLLNFPKALDAIKEDERFRKELLKTGKYKPNINHELLRNHNEEMTKFDKTIIENPEFDIACDEKGEIIFRGTYFGNDCSLLQVLVNMLGSMNFDDSQMFEALETIHNQSKNSKAGYNSNYTTEERISLDLDITSSHANLILCVLNNKNLVEYGTSLQNCWLTPLGEHVVKSREEDMKRIIFHEKT